MEKGGDPLKKVLMIGTGGTIASEMTPDGLTPGISPERLLQFVPAISRLCDVDCVSIFNEDSTNITPAHWVALARILRESYERYDGFVVSHGTDTMAYTSAAISYLVQNSRKPIVFTGAQKPIYFDSTDSKTNLTDAFVCACSEKLAGVSIVFNGRVILGTRARKTCSKSFAAFSSINFPDLASLQDHRLLCYLPCEGNGETRFFDRLSTEVGLIKLVPGFDIELLRFAFERKQALVIECFGVGGLPSYGDNAFFELVEAYTARGRFAVMTTQVQNEGSDLSVYRVGHRLKQNRRVLEAYDMTTECAYTKMMWILGQTRVPEAVQRLFYTPLAHDILHPETV